MGNVVIQCRQNLTPGTNTGIGADYTLYGAKVPDDVTRQSFVRYWL
ncbi:hypothetical protein [Pantoea sp. KPR_PJ]